MLKTSGPAEVLGSVFGYPSFRPGQREIIEAVLAGRDCVGVMPTGAGKSLTYQIPARLMGGTVLVVSPLISLMKDQVDAAASFGLKAAFLNSSLEPAERRARVDAIREGAFELVYAAPEGLEASAGDSLRGVKLSLIAVDEAHCISQWGHDFRPAYRNLKGLKERFGGAPVLALTATATHAVTDDIVAQLAMREPLSVRGSFFRPNLRLHAYLKTGKGGAAGPGKAADTKESVLRLVRARAGRSGIVYCLSRKSVESLAEFLRSRGVKALAYHAGMDAGARTQVQDAFRRDDADVIVATVAFGMGIDKPDVRFVIHRDMPRSFESYYQEIGRAGRDGAPSDCVLFYSWADVMSYDRFADVGDPALAEWHKSRVREMFRLAERRACRHQGLVRLLGETIAPCGSSCDVCSGADIVGTAPAVPTKTRSSAPYRPAPSGEPPAGSDLFMKLKALRKRLADARRVPAYMVFNDATLLQMAERKPRTEEEMRAVSGVGPKKWAEYGETFLAAVGEG